MRNVLPLLFESAPAIIIIVLLLLIQTIGLDTNLIGVYMLGELFSKNNLYKVFVGSIFITLLIDAIHVQSIGTWALSFFCAALIVDIVLRIIKIRDELDNYRMRNRLILTCAIAIGALGQTIIRKWLTGQTLAVEHIFSIVIASILYVLIRNMSNRKASIDYIKI